ncbi:MAG TPA: hypothetical protein PKA35_07435 [Paracoccus solventivorans]|uniref:hypothetical protein n=1 Tax=Paracoccus solventivorans TaxID=53463 RepID=UPI002CBE7AE3|nr:hypothetical protein [Paracoccus solventivorans]HMM08934.1 hypothetical protein [Paracoccus solventivorans]
MSAPLHMESPGGADNGDVLASIRRLISSGDAAAPSLAPQGAAPGNASPNVPFRLRPDALVATSAMGALSEPLADPAPRSLADPALLSPGRTDSAPLSRNPAEDAQAPHIAPPPTAPTAACAAATIPAARPEPQSDDEGTDMHVLHPATAPHVHLDATAEPAAAEATPHLHIPAPASTTPDAAPADNPLRALLRGAVRDELEREMRHRLETDLRQLIRTELSAALTEALTRPAAA